MHRVVRTVLVIVAVVVAVGCSAAPRPRVTVPPGWQTIQYRGLLLSVPGTWLVDNGTGQSTGQGAIGFCGDAKEPVVMVVLGDKFAAPGCGLDMPQSHVDFVALEPLSPRPSYSRFISQRINGESVLVVRQPGLDIQVLDPSRNVDLILRYGVTTRIIDQVLPTLRRA
jgi:hypothetical protein